MASQRTILIANIGSNDVKRLPGPTHVRERDAYASLLADYQATGPAFAGQIDAPILRAYIDLLVARSSSIDTVILFGSDQPQGHANDTIDGAYVLAKWVRDTYQDRVAEVLVVPIEVDGVNLYDRMFDYYGAVLPHVVPFDTSAGRPRYLVGLTGGTPAQSIGILASSVSVWGDDVEPLYVPDTRGTNLPATAITLHVASRLRQQAFRQPVTTLLEGGYFMAASQVLDTWNTSEATALAAGARAIQRWLDADLPGAVGQVELARRTLRENGLIARNDPDHVVAVIESLRRTLAGLNGTDDDSLRFSDLYWNASLCRDHGRLADFVGRATFLAEAVIRWLGSVAPGEETSIWDILPRIDHAVANSLRINGVHPSDIGFTRRCLRVLVGDPNRHVPTAGVRGVRNRSIVAHGFGAVSEGDIAEAIGHDLSGDNLGAWGAYSMDRSGSDAVLDIAWRLLGSVGMLPDATSPYLHWGMRLGQAAIGLAPGESQRS
ncbi:MAG: hypothetical protein NTX54_01055 [Chloroflexi bacterium]|nr:hypothetical protein [Chloroflexota bacterium]